MISAPSKNVKAPVVKIVMTGERALVPSSKGDAVYSVDYEGSLSVRCTCPDHARRRRTCKHMEAVDAVLCGARPQIGAASFESELVVKPASRKPALGGALAKVAREVELLRSEMTPASVAALDDEERADAMTDALGDEARDAASDADWDASYYYW